MAALRGPRAARGRRRTGAAAPPPGGLGVVDGWIVADGVERLALAGGGAGGDRARRPDHAGRRARDPGRPQRLERPGGGRGRAAVRRRARGHPPGRGRIRAASSIGSRPVAVIDGVRFVNDSQGTQPDAVIAALRAFPAPIVLIAGGRDKDVDLSAPRPRSSRSGRSPRSSSARADPTSSAGFRAAGLARTERRRVAGGRRPDGRRPGPRGPRRAAGRRAGRDRRPSCSARPPPASTCSPTTPPVARPSRRPSPALAAEHEPGRDR